jgi:hypothetical protein
MLCDESGHPRHAVDAGIPGDADALEALIVMNGLFIRILNGGTSKHGGNLVPDLAGVLIRVDPSSMQKAVIVSCKASNIDARAAVGYVGHVSDPRV